MINKLKKIIKMIFCKHHKYSYTEYFHDEDNNLIEKTNIKCFYCGKNMGTHEKIITEIKIKKGK